MRGGPGPAAKFLPFLAALLLGTVEAQADAVVNLCRSDFEITTTVANPVDLAAALAIGGKITFDCGSDALRTIAITRTHVVTRPVEIDGAGRIAFNGGRKPIMMFFVGGQQAHLTLRGLSIHGARKPSVLLPPVPAQFAEPEWLGSVVSGPGPLVIDGVSTGDCEDAYDVSIVRAQGRSVFSNNQGWVIRGESVALSDVSFYNNSASPVVWRDWGGSTRRATFDHTNVWGGGKPIVWDGELMIRDSAFGGNRNESANDGGGALRLSGKATIERTDFSGNSAASGGAIYLKSGELNLRRTNFDDNTAYRYGGAVAVGSDGPARVTARYAKFRNNKASHVNGGAISLWQNSATVFEADAILFAGNSAAQAGGGLWAQTGPVSMSRAIFVGNYAASGGAISADGARVALGNALIVRNSADRGGGFLGTWLTLKNSTVAQNSGGGLLASAPSVGPADAEFIMANSIVLQNGGGNCVTPPPTATQLVDAGNNLQFPGADCGGTIRSVDPFLDKMFVPLPGSPTRAAANDAVCLSDPLVARRDVFGANRPEGQHCTIGAIERDLESQAVRMLQQSDAPIPVRLRQFLEIIGIRRRAG